MKGVRSGPVRVGRATLGYLLATGLKVGFAVHLNEVSVDAGMGRDEGHFVKGTALPFVWLESWPG
jgi:hypothetical protein